MNALNNFLKKAAKASMPTLGGETVVWSGNNIEAIYHETTESETLDMGGFNPDGDSIGLVILTEDVPTSPSPKMGELITVRGEDWRIERITKGDLRWEFELVDKEKRSGV